MGQMEMGHGHSPGGRAGARDMTHVSDMQGKQHRQLRMAHRQRMG